MLSILDCKWTVKYIVFDFHKQIGKTGHSKQTMHAFFVFCISRIHALINQIKVKFIYNSQIISSITEITYL